MAFKDMHAAGPGCYELVGTRTATVRDQMLRAMRLVEELALESAITPDRPLLVIGGGAAGACAALTASQAGVPVVVIEQKRLMFSRQMSVTTRRIDPAEFDWPQEHWDADWPPPGREELTLPLQFKRGETASFLAREWQDDFRAAVEASHAGSDDFPGVIRVLLSTSFMEVGLNFDSKAWRIQIGDPGIDGLSFGAAISCVGLGYERVFITDDGKDSGHVHWRSNKFWSSDGLCNRGLQARGRNARSRGATRVLVSGSGDGAQQDIQRILCGDFGRPLLERRVFPQLPRTRATILAAMPSLRDADLERHRMLRANVGNRTVIEAALDVWDKAYTDLARSVWLDLSSDEQRALKERLLRAEVREWRSGVKLTWVLRSNRPGYCFGLNRFLTELVLLAYAAHCGLELWKPGAVGYYPITLVGHEILSVASAANEHACQLQWPAECAGHRHRVRFAEANSRTFAFWWEYHVIVVRNGVIARRAFDAIAEPEQMMPF